MLYISHKGSASFLFRERYVPSLSHLPIFKRMCHLIHSLFISSHLNITRQQIIPSFAKLRDTGKYLAQIFVRVNLAKLATLDDGINNAGPFCV